VNDAILILRSHEQTTDGNSANPSEIASGTDRRKLMVNHGDTDAQFKFALCLPSGDGIQIVKSLAARYSGLAVDRGDAAAECRCGLCLDKESEIPINKSLSVHYPQLAADQSVVLLNHVIVFVLMTNLVVQVIHRFLLTLLCERPIRALLRNRSEPLP
jgi:hypothetical protein